MSPVTKAAGSGEQLGLGEVKSGVPAVRGEEPTAMQSANGGGSPSIQQLLHLAIEKGADVGALEKLVGLHERMMDREAAHEFARALAAFQAECPPIGKSKEAAIATKSGGSYKYTYAPLEEIVRTVKPLLIKHGFSYGWDSSVAAGALTCVATLRHINGHSTSASFTLPIDNPSAMSPQQKVGAALTFAQRKTLESVLGLNTTEDDTDGVAREIDPTPISDGQLEQLEDLIADAEIDAARFLKFLAVAQLRDLPRVRFEEAKAAIAEKKRRKEGR